MLRLIADEDLGWPLNKRKGDEFEIGAGYARTLMLLRKAHEAPKPEKPKRRYLRRDMTATEDRMFTSEEDDQS